MQVIEFHALIRKGVIEVPQRYLKHLSRRVRVILLTEEDPQSDEDFIDELLTHPVQVNGFRPLTRQEIYAR